MKRSIFLFALFCLLAFAPHAARAADDPLLGYWQTQDKDGIVEFYRCGDAMCGRFVWLKDDSAASPSLDHKNQDADKRGRPLCGMSFLGDFHAEGGGRYDKGWIYSPRHGYPFSAALTLKGPDELLLRGYVFFSFLGGDQMWHRVAKPVPLCWALEK